MSEEVDSSIKRVLCARLIMYRIARPGIQWFWKRLPLLLPTAREGNVFKGVCHSVHNLPHGYSILLILVTLQSVRIPLKCFLAYKIISTQCYPPSQTETPFDKVPSVRDPLPPPGGHCCGRYAPYCNAFLFPIKFLQNIR